MNGVEADKLQGAGAEDLEFLRDPPPVGAPNFWNYEPEKRLAWNEYGDPAGEPVFYYHGWPSSRLQARLAHHLAMDRGLRLIAMDRPGMGKSTIVEKRRLEDWPALMAGFADHLGIGKFGQIGVSGGGPYVAACAAMIPDRLSRSVVLAGMVPLPWAETGSAGLHAAYRLAIRIRRAPAIFFTLLFRLLAVACKGRPDRFPMSLMVRALAQEDQVVMLGAPDVWPVITKSYTEGATGPGGGRGVLSDAEIYFQSPGFELEEIRHPIHYWHGGDDSNISPRMVERLAGSMPFAKLHLEEELGHFSLVVRMAPTAMDYLAKTHD